MQQIRAHWGSRLSFILAAAGSAIGLGNIWKFPYIAGTNGGGAFVLIYLVCIFIVGVPILIAELYVGQKSQKNNVEAFKVLYPKNKMWSGIGWVGMISAFLILSFYSVVGGWIIDFELRALIGQFSNSVTEESIKGRLGELFANPLRQTFAHFLFMAATAGIVLKGVKEGLEKWNKILMPTLLAILAMLFIHSMFLPGFGQAMSFLFSPDFSNITAESILEAVGHSFFTLSLGMGVILVYGSYLPEKENLVKVSFIVATLDTLIALASGVVIFSIVFSFGIEPGAGPGLIFSTLPVLFSKITGGSIVSVVFFLLVTFAALTSAVSILEVVVAYWTETHKTKRLPTTIAVAGIIFLLGMLTVLSTNQWSDIFNILGQHNFFDLFDKITSSYLLPIGGIFISLFFGWALGREHVAEALHQYPKWTQAGLLWTTRIVAPAAVIWVLYNKVFS